jgi:hypothetical protein
VPQRWVVWGLTAPPGRARDDGIPAPALAVKMAELADPEFAAADDHHRWIILLEGNEGDVAVWVEQHGEASAYAAYLLDNPEEGIS